MIMRFTKIRPTAEGFYFIKFRGQLGGKIGISVVKVSSLMGQLNAFWDGESFPVTDDCFLAFAGPIPLPE